MTWNKINISWITISEEKLNGSDKLIEELYYSETNTIKMIAQLIYVNVMIPVRIVVKKPFVVSQKELFSSTSHIIVFNEIIRWFGNGTYS